MSNTHPHAQSHTDSRHSVEQTESRSDAQNFLSALQQYIDQNTTTEPEENRYSPPPIGAPQDHNNANVTVPSQWPPPPRASAATRLSPPRNLAGASGHSVAGAMFDDDDDDLDFDYAAVEALAFDQQRARVAALRATSVQQAAERRGQFAPHFTGRVVGEPGEAPRLRLSAAGLVQPAHLAHLDEVLQLHAVGGAAPISADAARLSTPTWDVPLRATQCGVPRDWALCRWMAIEGGVIAIPSSPFFSPANKEQGANYVRFAFCKGDDTLKEAARRLECLVEGCDIDVKEPVMGG